MLNQNRVSLLMAGTMLLLSGASAAEQCQPGEKPLEFRFFTDNNSYKDNGWILECDSEDGHRELIWSIPIGGLDFASHTEVIREAACIPDTSTCTLNIFDATGNGLQGGNNGKPGATSFAGWFALLHGSNTVATYKGLDQPEFSELTYCVGPKCEQVPQSVHDEDCQDIVYLAMQLDNNPTDVSYQLICGGEGEGVFDKTVYWSGSGFTEPGAYIEEETCLPKDACCEFIVVDGTSNGLTDTVKASRNGVTQSKGFIYLEMNFETILEYDGSDGETFGVLTKKFACDADTHNMFEQPEEKDEDKDVITTVVVDIEEPDGEEKELTIEIEKDGEDEKVTVEIDVEDVEVADNVEGVFVPEDEEVKKDEDDKAFTDSFKNVFEDNIQDNEEDFINVDWFGTIAPTSEGWVEDDDFQNFNDDGKGFGTFDDEYLKDNYFGDDAFRTQMPTLIDPWDIPEEYYEGNSWFGDDVVEEDDTAWAYMDDQMLAPDGMAEIDGLIQDLDDHTLKLPSDPNAVALLDAQGQKVKKGLGKSAKIAIGVLVPVFVLWVIGLAACYYYGPREEDDEDSGKGTDSGSDLGESVVENV